MLGQGLTLNLPELPAERTAHPQLAPVSTKAPYVAADLAVERAGRLGR
jgi:hypothetical protein